MDSDYSSSFPNADARHAVVCPDCSAPRHEHCRSAYGKPLTTVHKARRDAYIKAIGREEYARRYGKHW